MIPATAAKPAAKPSPTTVAANLFVAAHMDRAAALGDQLAKLVEDPDAFVSTIKQGFGELADQAYADGSRTIAPGLGPVLGVRLPLVEATYKAFKRGTRKCPASLLIDVVDRLTREELRELRWFGTWNLERLLPTDPERAWQLLRRTAREADEWITVDTIAHPFGEGILRDPVRWAELERLVPSPSRWERRLVGSTLAAMPHTNHPGSRDALVVGRGLDLIGKLIGDPEPDVQKALSWALRTFAAIDPAATIAFVDTETLTASRNLDGNRAWVIRDTLSKLPNDSERLRQMLEGIRRRPTRSGLGDSSTANPGAAPRPPISQLEG
jgi:3-methyladenine DNA glycosylase AlkD